MSKYIDADKAIKDYARYGIKHFYDATDLEAILNECPAADVEEVQRGKWIPVTERLPETTDPVNITWVNRKPSGYNEHIKDKPFVATGNYCNGRWYWFSAVCQDYLNEYGDCEIDRIDPAIEVIAWMPLPEPYKGGEEEG